MASNLSTEQIYARRFRIKVGLITAIILVPLSALFLFIPVSNVLSGSYQKGVVVAVNSIDSSASVNYGGKTIYAHIACTGTGSKQACEVGPGGTVDMFVSYNAAMKRYEGNTFGSMSLMLFLGILVLIPTIFAIIGLVKPPKKAFMDKIIHF